MSRILVGEDDCHCPICDFLAQAKTAPPALISGDLELTIVDFTVESKQMRSTPAPVCYYTRGPPTAHFA